MVIVKVGFECELESLGCKSAGESIISGFEDYYVNESGKELMRSDLDIENIDLTGKDNDSAGEEIYRRGKELLATGERVIFLGGDHGMTLFLTRAFRERYENGFLIVFDAHADCASNGPLNFSWLRKLIESGFSSDKVILVGLRRYTKEEEDFLKFYNIRRYDMKGIHDLEDICDLIMEQVRGHSVYISIDIDVVDGAFVPGTACPEAGGLTSRQLIYFLQRLSILKELCVVDLVEINPKKDVKDITVKLGTKILEELA